MSDLEQRKRDLRQKQSLPLEGKIILAEQRIREWYDHWAGDVYISFSGGKDSTVLLDLVKRLYPDVPAVFVDTGLEYPEVRRFATERADVVLRPEMRFDQVIKTYGYPVVSKEVANTVAGAKRSIEKGVYSLRLCKLGVKRDEYGGLHDDGKYNYDTTIDGSKFRQTKWRFLLDAGFKVSACCCDVMKKRPLEIYEKQTGRKPIIATMAVESMNRESAWLKNGCNAFNAKKPKSTPMSFWTEQDVLHYLKQNNIPYCSVYGDIRVKPPKDTIDGQMNIIDYIGCYEPGDTLETTGCDRTGCMFCAFGIKQEGTPNRFQRMKETHPRQYAYCMKSLEEGGLGLREVLEYIGVPYE